MGDNNYFPQNHQQPDYRQNHYGQQGNQQADYGQQGSQYGQYQPPQYQQTSYQQQYSQGYNSPGGPSSPFYGFGGHGPDGTPWNERWWAIVGIAVLVIGAIAGLLFVLLSGDDDDAGGTPTEKRSMHCKISRWIGTSRPSKLPKNAVTSMTSKVTSSMTC